MPVTRVTSAQRAQLLAGNLTSHNIDATVVVNPSALPYTYGVAAYGWTGGVSVSGDTIGCLWDGDAVLPLLASPLLFGSNQNLLMGWIIENPTSGSVVASHSGIGTSLASKTRFLTAGVWSQAQPLDLDNIQAAVVSAVGSTSVASHTVTVPSILPASRVIAAHMLGIGKKVTAYNGTRVASAGTSTNGQLLMGECRGAASVNSTVTHNTSTGLYATFGLNLDPAALSFGAAGKAKAGVGRFGASVYRFAEPHPDRTYIVPPINAATQSSRIAGSFLRSADGVDMPVFAKDPDDTLDYTFYWTNHLADDDEITHVEHTAGGSLQVFSEALSPEGDATQVWINGGTTTVQYPVRIRFTTKKGRRHDRTFRIAGVQN